LDLNALNLNAGSPISRFGPVNNLHESKSVFNDRKLGSAEDSRLTYKQLSAKQEKNTLAGIRNIAVNTATGASLLTILLALLTRGSKGLAQKTLNIAKKATQFTFMTYGGFAALKAYGDNDTGVGLTQALEVAIPALTTDAIDLTMNRGFSIGLGNFVNEAKKYFSKSNYKSFSESAQDLGKSVGKFIDDLKTQPLKTITNFDGPGAMLMGLVTASAPLFKHVLGLDKLSSLMRHFPGMAMELGKVNGGVLKKGASKYFSSGAFMLCSSLINLFSGFSKNKDTKQTIELGTWLLNVVGRKLLVESIRENELAGDKNNKAVNPLEAIKQSLGSVFTWGAVS
jgi:hypothetical protein